MNNTLPWLVCGDFNGIFYASEKIRGVPREEGRMEMFSDALRSCDLVDVGYSGSWFTWERGNSMHTNIQERLNKGFANDLWVGLFPKMGLHHLPTSASDHCPLLLDLHVRNRPSKAHNFRFEVWWMVEKSFAREVSFLWNSALGDVFAKFDTL